MGFAAKLNRRMKHDLEDIGGALRGNMQVFAFRDVLLLTSQGLNGGLSIIFTLTVLGASPLDIGLLGTVNAISGISFLLIGGWAGDRYNRKNVFLLGTAITTLNPLMYAFAPSWEYLFLVNITQPIGDALAGPAGFSIRISSVKIGSLTRATASLYTIHALTNMVVPPIGAALVTLMGGLEYLRTIYIVEACINLFAWLYTARKLDVEQDKERIPRNGHRTFSVNEFFSDLREVYLTSRKEGTWLFLLLAATSPWVFNVDGNFQTVFVDRICLSPLIVIGFLPSVSALVSALLYMPIANLAEKRGRMNAVIMIRPLQYAGYILFILAGTFFIPGFTPYFPLLVWGLRSAGGVGGPGWEVASIEHMPREKLSTWQSLQNLISRLVGIPAPLVGGLLWNIDPRAPFLWHLSVDALFRYSIMRKIAKTQANLVRR